MHIVIVEPAALVDVNAVQNVLNQVCQDWYRIAPATWTVVSDAASPQLNAQLLPHMPPNGTILVMRVDPRDRQGWMPNKFWNWLRQRI